MEATDDWELVDGWEAWEPTEWVAARGASVEYSSDHFVIRWGASGASSARAAASAPRLAEWLERAWGSLCDPSSQIHFVTPYASPCWSADGHRRKLNVYIGDTGLDPHPQIGGWAFQGTYVEHGVEAVRHPMSNPEAKLHHSFLALSPGAAEAERTACHEFAHVLQMHTGGHLDTEFVGYQWEVRAVCSAASHTAPRPRTHATSLS